MFTEQILSIICQITVTMVSNIFCSTIGFIFIVCTLVVYLFGYIHA